MPFENGITKWCEYCKGIFYELDFVLVFLSSSLLLFLQLTSIIHFNSHSRAHCRIYLALWFISMNFNAKPKLPRLCTINNHWIWPWMVHVSVCVCWIFDHVNAKYIFLFLYLILLTIENLGTPNTEICWTDANMSSMVGDPSGRFTDKTSARKHNLSCNKQTSIHLCKNIINMITILMNWLKLGGHIVYRKAAKKKKTENNLLAS